MLDAFIIEEIQRREREQGRVQPQLERPDELPFAPHPPDPAWTPVDDDDENVERGVIVFDM
ncbi:MAG TPA: hypothetical protein DCQ06_01825 [Myxococcales bacterium]|nr:hypothetical protein [Myxococcales bacterium]